MHKKLYNKLSGFSVWVSDEISDFGGSWTFIFSFLSVSGIYMLYNECATHPFDAYPFPYLNLMLGFIASLQAPFILMSGNRQSIKDRKQVEKDIELDVKTHKKILELEQSINKILDNVQK